MTSALKRSPRRRSRRRRPLPRIDKLMRAASKAIGFALTAVRKVFDGARGKLDRERQAEKQADPL